MHVQMILFDCDLYFQRAKERKTYLDEDLDDDEIDGKRNYSVDEKLASTKYNKSFVVTDLKGEGRVSRLFELQREKTCLTEPLFSHMQKAGFVMTQLI